MKYIQKDWIEIYCKENKHLFEDYELISPIQRLIIEFSIKYQMDLAAMSLEKVSELVSEQDWNTISEVLKHGGRQESDIGFECTLLGVIFGFKDNNELTEKISDFIQQLGTKRTLH